MSLHDKQQYLRTQIVEKGYDAEKFYQFWQTFNIDLNDATMEDVYSVVSEFQNRKQQQQDDEFGDYVQPEQNQHHDSHFYQDMNWDFLADKKTQSKKETIDSKPKIQISSNKQIIQNNLVKTNKNQSEAQSKKTQNNKKQDIEELSYTQKNKEKEGDILISTDQPNLMNITFQDVINDSKSIKRKCLKLQPNILDHHVNVQIEITKYKQVVEENPGIINKLWKGTYLLFTIKTVGRNKQKAIGISWEVQRQHSDFQWLRNTLLKMYPGIVVPPLPGFVKTQPQLNGYQRKLQSFLLDCYNCPQLRNSKYFQVFLSYSQQKDFDSFKKSCENTTKPKNLAHILNMEGQISLLYSEKLEGYSLGLQKFLTKSSQHLKNVKNIISQIDELYTNVSNKFKQLSQVFITMTNQSCEFSEQQCYPRLTETYKQISQLVCQHSYFCVLQKQFLQTFMQSHFSYERDRIDNMQTLISKRKTFVVQYSKPKHQLEKPTAQANASNKSSSMFGKIASLFGEKTQTVDAPSTETATLHEQVGFYNSQLMRESIRCIQGMISSHINHFSIYGHTRINNVEEMQKLWSKILVELSKLKAS